MDVASRVAGHVAADPVVVDAVADAEPVGHHRGEAAEVHGWAAEGAGGEDVVVDGGVSWVRVQAVQSLAVWVGQVSHGEQVTVETLAWREEENKWLVQQSVCVFWDQFCLKSLLRKSWKIIFFNLVLMRCNAVIFLVDEVRRY